MAWWSRWFKREPKPEPKPPSVWAGQTALWDRIREDQEKAIAEMDEDRKAKHVAAEKEKLRRWLAHFEK